MLSCSLKASSKLAHRPTAKPKKLAKVQKRYFEDHYYYSKFIPMTGVPLVPPDLTPWDQTIRPKRIKVRCNNMLERMVTMNDWDTLEADDAANPRLRQRRRPRPHYTTELEDP